MIRDRRLGNELPVRIPKQAQMTHTIVQRMRRAPPVLSIGVPMAAILILGGLYWQYGHVSAVGSPCGGDFHVKPCPDDLVCVPNHPWSGGMGTGGTCRKPVPFQQPRSLPTFPDKGTLLPPVKGAPSITFNETTRVGGKSRGLVWEPQPPTEIVSPGVGYVIHAQDFRGYGNLVILQSSDGFHLLIAGITNLAVKHGDAVQPGTLLGSTAVTAKPSGTNARDAPGANPAIYFELRKDGEPIDPLPWLLRSEDLNQKRGQ